MTRIVALETRDVRFPTSGGLHGSDAMNPDPDYSAAYVILSTEQPGLEGHGLTFTIGRGNEICIAAIESLRPYVLGQTLEGIASDPGAFWRWLTGDSQLRWIGPDKGAIHMATAAVVNAAWDLWAKSEGKPLWRLLCGLSPEELVAAAPLHYLEDAITADEALDLLRRQASGREARIREMERDGFPAYVTSAGWLGYPEQEVRRLAREALDLGFTHFKMKVGGDLANDVRRAAALREEIGWERTLMMDANQVWSVPEAVESMRSLARFDPLWIEEPTHPDDVLGHAAIARSVAPIKVATGEHCANRVMFKQMLQAGAMGFCQVDACRLAGVNEVIAVLLLAAKYGVPVCPHAGGVGLCEYVQHLSIFDYVCVSASLEDRVIEYVDHLHEHFLDPVSVRDGRYAAPRLPGYSVTMRPESLNEYRHPNGAAWRRLASTPR